MIKILHFRKAILLIHGFAGGNYDYGQLGNDLQFIKNFDVFTFTLPGHDKTIINNVSKNEWIKSAEAQLIKIINKGYKEIYLIGHSMGGVIASYLVLLPNQIRTPLPWGKTGKSKTQSQPPLLPNLWPAERLFSPLQNFCIHN